MGIEAICKKKQKKPILSTSESIQWAINNLNGGSGMKAEKWDVPVKDNRFNLCVHEMVRLQFKILNSKQPTFSCWKQTINSDCEKLVLSYSLTSTLPLTVEKPINNLQLN